MEFTVQWFINSTEHSLRRWKQGVREIEEETFEYDNSLSVSATQALYRHKVEVCKKTLEYLRTLPINKVIATSFGCSEECSKYYDLINS